MDNRCLWRTAIDTRTLQPQGHKSSKSSQALNTISHLSLPLITHLLRRDAGGGPVHLSDFSNRPAPALSSLSP